MNAAQQQPRMVLQVVAPSRFVTIELAASMTGLTEKAIRCRIDRGDWAEGIHYRRREGRVFIDMEAYEKWVERGTG